MALPMAAEASAVFDSRPSSTMSVVRMAIWASWVTIIGAASTSRARASPSHSARRA